MDKAAEVKLIRKAKAGDGAAIEALIRTHQAGVFAFVLRMSGRPHIAEDIVQEAFVRVLKNLDRFDTRYRFSTWLFTIARRLYVNAMQKHRPAYDTDTVDLWQGTGMTPVGHTVQAERTQAVHDLIDTALDGLNEQQREIILLFHQQDWSIGEIAVHLHMPEGTVKSHLHRARKRMKRLLLSCPRRQAQVEEVWS